MSCILIESTPTVKHFILVNEEGSFYDCFQSNVFDEFFLSFTSLPKHACCFNSKSDVKKWMNKNKNYIKKSKHKLTIKELDIHTSVTYTVK